MNPAMAGLGALTKQNSQPTGRSPESMSQTMALAKQMSDMQLADVLAGKSMNIPQYVAMTEAMGRKQLRTAMQGITAMTSAKQPTEREKLLSEMMPRQAAPSIMNAPPQGAAPQGAGLDQLPADNMQGLGHADGGIIAFADRGQVHSPKKSFWDVVDPAKYQTEPGYRAFVDEPDITDKTYKNYLESGNAPPLTEKQLADARFENSYNLEKDWRNSPEGKKADIQAQQMGEPSTTLPSKVKAQSWTEMIGGDQKEGTRIAERTSGLNPGDYARMQAAQANPIGPKTPAGTATPVGGRPNNMPLGISPDMLERLKGQKEQFVETMRGPAPGGNAGSFNLLNPGAVPPSYNPNALSEGRPSSTPEAQLSRDGVDPTDASEFLNTLKTTGVAPPKTGGSTGAVPPRTGSGPGGSGPGGSGPGGGGPGGGGPGGYGGGRLPQTDLASFAEKQAELLRPKERNKDYYEALTKPTEDIAKQVASGKSQAQGEFLMNIGAALMSTPNIGLALSKGVQAGLPGLAASRKEINALTKDQRDYQFNIAKAKEARDQGDEMLALNYLKLAEESKYHAGMVGAYMARASGGANALGPKQYQAAMKNATTAIDARIAKITNPMEKREATKNRDQLIEAEFTRNIGAYQTGVIPKVDDDSDVFEKPGGPLRTRTS